ncbi:hypothetical protein F5B18DRAFT_600364 [Nemania serpens]|nr:hypothetical protein F5B18DRAFT_600364 [Nemania serpens]
MIRYLLAFLIGEGVRSINLLFKASVQGFSAVAQSTYLSIIPYLWGPHRSQWAISVDSYPLSSFLHFPYSFSWKVSSSLHSRTSQGHNTGQ